MKSNKIKPTINLSHEWEMKQTTQEFEKLVKASTKPKKKNLSKPQIGK
jgi:hypothetical protein